VQGRLDQAIGKYEQALELEPEYVQALNDLGMVYIQKGWYSRAIGVFEKAININPDFIDPRSGMAEAYYHLKNYDQCITEASTAIEYAPEFEWPYYWRGMARFQKGEMEFAEQDLATATRKNSRLGIAHLALGDIYAKNGLTEKAERRYRAALDADPNLISVYGSWAYLKMGQKDWDAAFELLKRGLQKAPRTPWLHTQMGMVYLARGERAHSQGDKDTFRRETEKSMDHFKTALRFDRTDRDASLGLKEARRRLAAVD
jgi:tetratricopeptide (TPR) repeat protein